MRERFGADADGLDFLFFTDLTRSVRDDVATIRDSPFLPEEVTVFGLVHDVKTGRPRRVVCPLCPSADGGPTGSG